MAERGGSVPVIGRHSTMLRPDSVRRVTPPTTIIPNTRDAETSNQFATDGGESGGSWVVASDGVAVAGLADDASEFNPSDEKAWEVKNPRDPVGKDSVLDSLLWGRKPEQ